MSEKYYGSSGKKKTPLYVLKQQQRKMKRSYKKGDQIKEVYDKIKEKESKQADKELYSMLNSIDN